MEKINFGNIGNFFRCVVLRTLFPLISARATVLGIMKFSVYHVFYLLK